MSVWPFVPREEFVEAMEWRTDVMQAYSAEQRARLTSTPRQRFTFDHLLTARHYQRARAMMLGGAASAWTIPLWHEKQAFTCGSGATTLAVDTTASDYRVGGVAVLWQDNDTCEEVTISAVGGSSLTTSATSRAYTTGARIMPGLTGRIVGGLEVSRTVEDFVAASVEWICYTGKDLSGGSLYSGTYRSHKVITDAAVLGSGSVTERIVWPEDVVDNGIAGGYHDTVQSLPQANVHAAWLTTTQAELWALRQFLHSLYGRHKGVWIPEWTAGLSVQANITAAGTTITILAVGLNSNVETGDLMVVTTAGVQHYFRFTSVAPSGANEVITLSAAAGVNVTTAEVARCCLMRFCRLSGDRVEIVHANPSRASVMCEFDEVPVP